VIEVAVAVIGATGGPFGCDLGHRATVFVPRALHHWGSKRSVSKGLVSFGSVAPLTMRSVRRPNSVTRTDLSWFRTRPGPS